MSHILEIGGFCAHAAADDGERLGIHFIVKENRIAREGAMANLAAFKGMPSISSLGFALFLAVNATAVWGGVFPFLPLSIQTDTFTSAFFLAQSLVFAFSYLASTLGVYFFPEPTRRFLVWAAGVPYFIGWCCLVGAVYAQPLALSLAVGGGAFIGLGSAGFYMAWQRLFASQKPAVGNRDLIVGMLVAPVFYFALYLIPIAVTVFLIPLVFMPLFSLCIVLASRSVNLDQPMFFDVPREHPGAYLQTVKDYWRSALSIGAFALSCGVMRSLAVATPEAGTVVNLASMVGMLVAAAALMATWQFKSLRVNVSLVFRVLFPFVITAFLLIPFLGEGYLMPFAGVLYAIYNCAIILMMIQCAQASRDRGINPVFIYGFFAGVVYLLHDLGYLIGLFVGNLEAFGLQPLTSIALFSVYLLAVMYFVGQGGFAQALSPNRVRAEHIELIPTAAAPATRHRPSAGAQGECDEKSGFHDRLSKQCVLVKKHYKLSDREAEIMELMARGSTVPGIAQRLMVSENTVRTHTKRIYTKLDIHKKQEMLDLLRSFNPRALGAESEKRPTGKD